MQAVILGAPQGTRFHFGNDSARAESDSNALASVSEYLHSDTLFGALVNAWALAIPESVDRFIQVCKEGAFKVSSAYYCVSYQDKMVYFLPKPVSLNLVSFNEPKRLKKIKFVSQGVWDQGVPPEQWFDEDKCTLLQNGTIVALRSEIDIPLELFSLETSPKVRARNVADRKDSFYYQTDLFLSGGEDYEVSWYFIMDNHLPDELQADLIRALDVLVQLGIGGERSSGCGGLSSYTIRDFSPTLTSDVYSSISLVAPRQDEDTSHSLYQLIKRGGRYVGDGGSLPVLQMLLEGAIFDRRIEGTIVSLHADPPMLRYGMGLYLPVHPNYINDLL